MKNQELIKQARQTNLVAYLIDKGESLKRVGKNFMLESHDSLYIKDNMFIWYSRNTKGNSIDFLMYPRMSRQSLLCVQITRNEC